MRILVLCYEYPPVGGGGGRVAASVGEALAGRGHAVRAQTAALGWRSPREIIKGVEVFRTASGRRLPDTCTVREMGQFLATSFLPMLRHLARWKPDVIHAHFAMPTGLLAWAAHRLSGVPYVLTAHLGDVPGGVPAQTDRLFKIIGPVARRVWREAAAATAVSSFVQELAERAYARPVARILNGIDLADAPPAPAPVSTVRELVFLGRFNPQKNAPLLIEALAQIPALPWRLTMIGDGADLPRVRELLAQHRLSNRVTLTGWLDAPRVQEALKKADVLCLPSSSEGMPVAAVEALKWGVAIVGSDIPGLRDVATHGQNARLAAAGDATALAHALREVITDDGLLAAMKASSHRRARDFDLAQIAAQYEQTLCDASVR